MQGQGFTGSPVKRNTAINIAVYAQPSLSPSKGGTIGGVLRSPNGGQGQRQQINWNELIRKEQDKVIKQLQYQIKQQQQDQNHNGHNHHSIKEQNHHAQEEDDTNDGQVIKHPYIQACFDREIMTKKYLIKTSQIPQAQLKELTHKDKNLITDLPDSSNQILFNGIELSMKKVFGQYQYPINKSIHFISNQTVIYFVGNYIAMHNMAKDETRYIGIDSNLQMITAFEVQTVDFQLKSEKVSLSPTRQHAQSSVNYIQESTVTTNQSPLQKPKSLKLMSAESTHTVLQGIVKSSTVNYSKQASIIGFNTSTTFQQHQLQNQQNSSPGTAGVGALNSQNQQLQLTHYGQTASGNHINGSGISQVQSANQVVNNEGVGVSKAAAGVSQHHRDMQTLIAYADKAKETHLKEQKFQSKKVYGIQNSKNKRTSNFASKVSGQSPSNQNRQNLAHGFQSLTSPTRYSPSKGGNIGGLSNSMNNLNGVNFPNSPANQNNDSPTLFNLEEVQNVKYLVKVNVFTLANPNRKYVLQHFFDEYFYVQQISIRDKESLCYTLCTNQSNEQLFFIWNFRKETVIGHVEMKNKINKFVVTPNKAELILFLGEKYLKYYEANFTNKIIKENSLNIIPMKIEKESNFIDMEYINPRQGGQHSNNQFESFNGPMNTLSGDTKIGGSANPGVGDMFVLITENTNSVYIFERNQLKHKLIDQFKQPRIDLPIATEDNELNKTHDSVLSDSLEIGELSDREDIGRAEDHLRVKSQGTNPHKINPILAAKKRKDKQEGGTAGFGKLNIQSFQNSMKVSQLKKRTQDLSQVNRPEDQLKSPQSSQIRQRSDDRVAEDNPLSDKQDPILENIDFQKISVTSKGFIIGCSNGYLVCYEFKNDYEPKLVNKVHISNKIKAIQSMSLSKGTYHNDDYMVGVAGVYQKEIKRAFRRQAEGGDGLRTYSRKNSMQRGIQDQAQGGGSLPPNSRDFFMPQVIKALDPKRNRKSERSLEGSRKRVSQLGNLGGSSRFILNHQTHSSSQKRDDINVQNLFGPGDLVEKQEFLIVNMKAIQTQQHNKIVEKIFAKGAHDGSIFQMAQCRNKSSFYTISDSNNLKIWNHTNEWRGAQNFKLDEQPLCIDVHPSSWQIALGYKSGIKIYQTLGKEMKLSFEKLGKAALSIAYADGGHMLACTNAVYVDIIDPIRMQLLVTLFGHKGLVRNLSWTLNSKYLISTCSNGGLFFWKGNFKEQTFKLNAMPTTVPSLPEDPSSLNSQSAQTITPLGQNQDKNYLYNHLAYDDELDVVIALTSTSTLRLLINNGQEPIYEEDMLGLGSLQSDSVGYLNIGPGQFSSNIFSSVKATSMSFSKSLNILVVGFSNGKISVISWPIIPNLRTFKYDVMLQANPITDVRFSYASRYLMACTDDGNIFVMDTFKSTEGLE